MELHVTLMKNTALLVIVTLKMKTNQTHSYIKEAFIIYD